MGKTIKITRGLDIKLVGAAEKVISSSDSTTFAIKPTDFNGIFPKLLVKEGDDVLAGQPLYYDKNHEKTKVVSPVSGEVAEIVRGEKRKILEIRILADKELRYFQNDKKPDTSLSREQLIELLQETGLFAFIKQRPYDVAANPTDTPKAIFISGLDTAPLAADTDFILNDKKEAFQEGLNVLAKLTPGKVYLALRNDNSAISTLKESKGVEFIYVSGPHPAGNVGVHIHHTLPINKGERVWTLSPQDVLLFGRYFTTGKFDATRLIALAGSEVLKPRYYKTILGASIKGMVENNVKDGHHRFISGNPLTGEQITKEGYIGAFHTSVTVLPEGSDESRFLGWITPNLDKFSASRAWLFSWLMPNKKYALNTNTNGEERAFVMTGQYESVFPFDIYPVFLLKAILTNDIEKMEHYGIYEVAPEDFALCEFVCTSKMDLQPVVRKGLDLVQAECG